MPQSIMSSYLVKKQSKAKGVVPAAASFVVPGVGQLINGQGTKPLGVFGVALATGAAFMTGLPLIGAVIGVAHLATHGPMFTRPVEVRVGEVVEREGFVFADLLADA